MNRERKIIGGMLMLAMLISLCIVTAKQDEELESRGFMSDYERRPQHGPDYLWAYVSGTYDYNTHWIYGCHHSYGKHGFAVIMGHRCNPGNGRNAYRRAYTDVWGTVCCDYRSATASIPYT